MSLAGLLLAGGRSSRFGSEKAVAPFRDERLMDVPLTALRSVCEIVAVSCRPDAGAAAHAERLGLERLTDRSDDVDGPLAGVRKGLEWAKARGHQWLAVAPCDAADLTAFHLSDLNQKRLERRCAVVARSDNGVEPLISILPVDQGLDTLRRNLAAGVHPPVRRFLATLNAVEIPLPGLGGLNVNRPDDLPGRSINRLGS